MANLTTKYLNQELKNPIIVGANNLSEDLSNIKMMEDAGAAAIVYKSLFEEQIQLENLQIFEHQQNQSNQHSEMMSWLPDLVHAGPEEYLNKLRKAQEAVDIPIFASLNAVYFESWIEFSKKIEQTGVNGLELNFYYVPSDFELMDKAIIHEKLDILTAVKEAVNIPIAVKLSPFYTNPLYIINEMDKIGANAFVLFNKFFQPKIDIDKEEMRYPNSLSCNEESRLPLRYAGLLFGNINADICSSRGIFTAEDAISMILAGANSMQIVSAIYKHGFKQITSIVKGIEEWMDKKSYKNLNDFRGKLSRKNIKDPFAYKRAQYVDILLNSETN